MHTYFLVCSVHVKIDNRQGRKGLIKRYEITFGKYDYSFSSQCISRYINERLGLIGADEDDGPVYVR